MDKYTATEMAYKHGYEKGYEAGQSDVAAECQSCAKATKKVIESLQRKIATDNNVGCKWIPVSERLPEGDKVVLCYKADRGIKFGIRLDATYADGVQAFKDKDRAFAFGATHWMPLPEPPKEGE